jgi:hypothetical protein
VLSEGEPMVLNSDSDSDLDSLSELEWSEPEATLKASKSKGKKEAQGSALRKPLPARKEADFGLFVQKAQQHAEKGRKIAQVKADLEEPIADPIPPAEADISEEVLASAVHDEEDPDKARRLYLAMQRTNALHSECVYHFFDGSQDSVAKGPSFPINSLPDHRWTSSFQGWLKPRSV